MIDLIYSSDKEEGTGNSDQEWRLNPNDTAMAFGLCSMLWVHQGIHPTVIQAARLPWT